jgi:asparagine synthase (glutamine-hydrolysing)
MLGGYDIFKEVKIRAFWAGQPESRLRPLLLGRLYPYMPQLQSQPPAYLRAFFHIGREDTESPLFSHLPRWRLTSKLKRFFSEAVKAELSGCDAIASMDSLLPASYRAWSPFTRAQYLEARFLLPGYILSSQGDRVAMAHSVEGRFPFLDHRVAEFASRLPPRLKMNALKEKYLLKRIAARFVPLTVVNRPKQPYRAPDACSFFRCSGENEYVEELLEPARIHSDGMFDPLAVQKLVDKARRGNLVSVADNMAVVGVLSTQLLLDQFITHFRPDRSPGI